MASKLKKRAKLSPHVALDPEKQKEFNQRTEQAKKKAADGLSGPGVIYISRLPWGFVEQPLKSFFKQFGKVQKLRISRSKKTGNSKGYAYVQFANVEVAKIAADTMNNYLMFDKLIKCKFLQDPHPDTFKNADRPFFKPKGPRKSIDLLNKPKTEEARKKSQAKSMRKLSKTKKKLEELGIDYSVAITGVVKEEPESEDEDMGPESENEDVKEEKVQKKDSKISKASKVQAKDSVETVKRAGKDSKVNKKNKNVKVKAESKKEPSVDEVEGKEETAEAEPRKLPKRQLRAPPSKQKIKKQKR